MEGEVVDLKCDELNIKPEWDIFLGPEYSLTKSYVDAWNAYCQWINDNPEPKYTNNEMNYMDWYDERRIREMSISDERLKILRKHHAPKTEIWNWLTLAPKPMLRFEDADRLNDFCSEIMDPRTIKSCQWVVECGKSEQAPNIHCHILFRHMNEGLSKNFKRKVCNRFKKVFSDRSSEISWSTPKGRGWYNQVFRSTNNPTYKKMIQDKRDYMDNFQKSACHENFMDLNLKGGF